MVEYILLVALIALAVIAAVSFLGGTMTTSSTPREASSVALAAEGPHPAG